MFRRSNFHRNAAVSAGSASFLRTGDLEWRWDSTPIEFQVHMEVPPLVFLEPLDKQAEACEVRMPAAQDESDAGPYPGCEDPRVARGRPGPFSLLRPQRDVKTLSYSEVWSRPDRYRSVISAHPCTMAQIHNRD